MKKVAVIENQSREFYGPHCTDDEAVQCADAIRAAAQKAFPDYEIKSDGVWDFEAQSEVDDWVRANWDSVLAECFKDNYSQAEVEAMIYAIELGVPCSEDSARETYPVYEHDDTVTICTARIDGKKRDIAWYLDSNEHEVAVFVNDQVELDKEQMKQLRDEG